MLLVIFIAIATAICVEIKYADHDNAPEGFFFLSVFFVCAIVFGLTCIATTAIFTEHRTQAFNLHESAGSYLEVGKDSVYVYLDDKDGYRLTEISRGSMTVIQTEGQPRVEFKCTSTDVSNWVLFPFKQDITFDCSDDWGDREKTLYVPAGSMNEDTLKEFAS